MEEGTSAWLPSSLCNRRRDNGSEKSRTLHNVFKLPMPIFFNFVANITANSSYVRYINSSSLIIIDKVSMCPLQILEIIDRLLRDLCDENDKHKPFGGKTILLCGNFFQILSVIPHQSRGTLIENCVTNWHEFSYFHKITLTRNTRALSNKIEFVEFLKKKMVMMKYYRNTSTINRT